MRPNGEMDVTTNDGLRASNASCPMPRASSQPVANDSMRTSALVDEFEEAGAVGGVVEIEHDRRLASVLEPPRQVLLDVRPRRISEQTLRSTGITSGRFDLEDVGAQVGEQATAQPAALDA